MLKPYILDLVPGNSLVEHLVEEGFDVYLLDFGISGPADAGLSLEDLVLDYIPGAVREVLETSGAAEISLFGQSQGGTLSAMYASLFPDRPLKNLVLLSAPTEFAPRNPGPFGLWTLASGNSGAFFDPAMVPRFFGNLPTDFASHFINLAASLQATGVSVAARPIGRGFSVYDAALRQARRLAECDVSMRSWLAVSKWVDDAAPFPGEIFRKLGRGFLPARRARQGTRRAPRNQGEPLQHPLRRAQRLGQVGLRRPALPDRGHHYPGMRPGSGVRLFGRRARGDAGWARGYG